MAAKFGLEGLKNDEKERCDGQQIKHY